MLSLFRASLIFGLIGFALNSLNAQQISAPIVHPASAAKTSASNDIRSMIGAAPVRIWKEGDPVIVKDDLRKQGTQQLPSAVKQPDQALGDIASSSQFAADAAAHKPQVVKDFDGIPATGVLPPDTVGAVGPDYYIQMVNSLFAIFDKKGNLKAGPAPINSLWKRFKGPCETKNEGDPIVRYDHLANRWLVSQFALHDHFQCIATSRTSDPMTGGWFLYAFPTVDGQGNPVDSDYPKIGVWPDGYYMSTQRGFPSEGMDVWVFERDKMLQGQPARQVQFTVNAPSIILQPSDLNGQAPPAGTPNFFVRPVSGQVFAGGADRVEIFEFSVNWNQPSLSTFKQTLTLPTTPFNSSICDGSLGDPCVPQPGTNVKLDTLSVWPMFRAQYRNFGDKEVLLLNHTVDATGRGQAGVRWYELRRIPGGAWNIFQQGTHAPDAVHRWMGSMAMDAAGNIAVAYSVSSSQTFPGLRVAMREDSDPVGTLGPESLIQAGGGSQTDFRSRWGDYSSMDVDPAHPCDFWFASLYYESMSQAGWKTHIAQIRSPLFSPDCEPVVPNLVGTDVNTAAKILKTAGLELGDQTTVPDAGKHSGMILGQSKEPGTKVPKNARINVTVPQ
ncbi:MAG TPA: PASTA domain-containing protein [Candidatus Angelobacter sp.]|nr:PASTA domain-containing protein [Candidatus Angelobacter sp.]